MRRVADRMGITHGNLQYYFRTTPPTAGQTRPTRRPTSEA
ncbi:hypothetical protein [Cupriavidus pinatubonensis]